MKLGYEEAVNQFRIANPNPDKVWFARTLAFMAQMPKGQSVLDVGCGAAELAVLLRDPGQHTVTCTDIASNSVLNASAKGFEAHQVDLGREDLPFASKRFDVVTLLEVIEHIFDTDHVLFEIHRVLRDDGYLIVSTPNISCWPYRLHALKGNIPWKEGHHVRFFNPRRLELYLFMDGFDIVDSAHVPTNVGRRFSPRWLIYRSSKLAARFCATRWRQPHETLFVGDIVYLCRKNAKVPPVGVGEHCWSLHSGTTQQHRQQVLRRTEHAFDMGLIRDDIVRRISAHL